MTRPAVRVWKFCILPIIVGIGVISRRKLQITFAWLQEQQIRPDKTSQRKIYYYKITIS